MAIQLTITDGVKTVILGVGAVGGVGYLRDFAQNTPAADDTSQVDSFDILLTGGNAAIATTIADLETLFERGRRRYAGAYGINWVWLQLTIDSDVWQSPVMDGRVVGGGPDWLKYERAVGTRRVSLVIQREAYWESSSESTLTLTNVNTSTAAGLTVYNCDDQAGSPKRSNHFWASMAAGGDLPSPVRLHLASIGDLSTMRISHEINNHTSTTYFQDVTLSGGATTVDASCAFGSYSSKTSASLITSTTAPVTADMPYMQGVYYRVLARVLLESGVQWKFTPMASDSGGQLFTGAPVYITAEDVTMLWQDLGVVPLPILYISGETWAGGQVYFTALPVDGASHTLKVDCVQVTPLDGWKVLGPLTNPGSGGYVDLDGARNTLYHDSSGIKGYPIQVGEPLLIYPNVVNHYRLLWRNSNAGYNSDITSTVSVTMFYRPRRRFL